jgi:uncharacterized glyoxalase superfamily protein PhnB
MSEVIPYLAIRDAAKAIDFYAKAFGARETFTLSTKIEDVPDDELQRRAAEVEKARRAG